MNRLLLASVTLVLATLSTGCVRLDAVSTPPPTKGGEHTGDPFGDDYVRLARGTVLAFDCTDTFDGSPCDLADFQNSSPDVVGIKQAFLEREPSPWHHAYDARPRTGFVLVGKKPGRSTLLITSSVGEKSVDVVVE